MSPAETATKRRVEEIDSLAKRMQCWQFTPEEARYLADIAISRGRLKVDDVQHHLPPEYRRRLESFVNKDVHPGPPPDNRTIDAEAARGLPRAKPACWVWSEEGNGYVAEVTLNEGRKLGEYLNGTLWVKGADGREWSLRCGIPEKIDQSNKDSWHRSVKRVLEVAAHTEYRKIGTESTFGTATRPGGFPGIIDFTSIADPTPPPSDPRWTKHPRKAELMNLVPVMARALKVARDTMGAGHPVGDAMVNCDGVLEDAFKIGLSRQHFLRDIGGRYQERHVEGQWESHWRKLWSKNMIGFFATVIDRGVYGVATLRITMSDKYYVDHEIVVSPGSVDDQRLTEEADRLHLAYLNARAYMRPTGNKPTATHQKLIEQELAKIFPPCETCGRELTKTPPAGAGNRWSPVCPCGFMAPFCKCQPIVGWAAKNRRVDRSGTADWSQWEKGPVLPGLETASFIIPGGHVASVIESDATTAYASNAAALEASIATMKAWSRRSTVERIARELGKLELQPSEAASLARLALRRATLAEDRPAEVLLQVPDGVTDESTEERARRFSVDEFKARCAKLAIVFANPGSARRAEQHLEFRSAKRWWITLALAAIGGGVGAKLLHLL